MDFTKEEGEIPPTTINYFQLGKEFGKNNKGVNDFLNGMLESPFEVEFETNHEYFPVRSTEGSVGYDLFSPRNVIIAPSETEKVRLGIILHFKDKDQYAQIVSRSGLACIDGIEVVGSGIIDPDYNHEICCYIRNTSLYDYVVYAGDRICQLIFHPFHRVNLVCQESHGQREIKKRNEEKRLGGFGSTGK